MNFSTLSKLYAASLLGMSLMFVAIPTVAESNSSLIQGDETQLREYGPTTSTDTFWRIANNVRPDQSVSIYQVMAAIFQANPHAFASDNYNSLRRGVTLVIPPKSVMAAIPRQDAQQKATVDDQGWKSSHTTTKTSTSTPSASNSQQALLTAQKETDELRQRLTEAKAQLAEYQKLEPELQEKLAQLQAEKAALLAEQITLQSASTDEQLNQEFDLAMSDLEAELQLQNNLVQTQQKQITRLETKLQQAQQAQHDSSNILVEYWYAIVGALLIFLLAIIGFLLSRRKKVPENYHPVPSVQSREPLTSADEDKRQQAVLSNESKNLPKEDREITKVVLNEPIIAPELDLDEGPKVDQIEVKEDIDQLLQRLLTQKPVDAETIPETSPVVSTQPIASAKETTEHQDKTLGLATSAAGLATGVAAVDSLLQASKETETETRETIATETTATESIEKEHSEAEALDNQTLAPQVLTSQTLENDPLEAEQSPIADTEDFHVQQDELTQALEQELKQDSPALAQELEQSIQVTEQEELAQFEAELTAQIQNQAEAINEQEPAAQPLATEFELPPVTTDESTLTVQHDTNVEMDDEGILEFTLEENNEVNLEQALQSLAAETEIADVPQQDEIKVEAQLSQVESEKAEPLEFEPALSVESEQPKAETVAAQNDEFIDIAQLLNDDSPMLAEGKSYTLELADDDSLANTQSHNAEINFNEKLNLAQVYMEMGEPMQAEQLLIEVSEQGSQEQQQEAVNLLSLLKK